MGTRAPWFALLSIPVAVAAPAHATIYLSIEAAQRQMFPAESAFSDRSVELTSAQRRAVAQLSGEGAPKKLRVWEVHKGTKRLGWFVVDRVLGKHDYITYAVSLNGDGSVRSVEILEYRETYGDEIRDPRWRRQFVGKGADSALELDRDIKNISGATLSSQHVTQGIKRIVSTFSVLFAGS